MAEQLTFDLPVREALDREAFFVSDSNRIALATLDTPALWPNAKLVLTGPNGAGKSHLTHVWATAHNAVIISANGLCDIDIPEVVRNGHIAVEDVDQLRETATPDAAEQALFHLHNLCLAEGGTMLMTACAAPNHWNLKLPDLVSRMTATSVVRIDEPDDALLSALLVKQFDDRQLVVSATLIPYLVARIERSAAAVRDVVDRIDHAALQARKPVSQKLAARVLDNLAQ